MIKKMVLVLIIIAGLSFAMAQEDGETHDYIITQEELDAVDFDTFNLMYEFYPIEVFRSPYRGWVVYTKISYLSVYPINHLDGSRTYDVQFFEEPYLYDDFGFFNCAYIQGNNMVGCFETFVLPQWINKFLSHDTIYRQKLKSLQTGGEPFVSPELENYLIGGVE